MTTKKRPAKSPPKKGPGKSPAKRRPAKSPGKSSVDDAQRESAGEQTAPEQTAPEQTAPEQGKKLPAFGFAEDLLATTSTAPEAVDDTDPNRIFAFADGLEASRPDDPPEAPVELRTCILFSLASEIFALPVEPVHEVVRVTSITRVPHAPTPIRGVTNLRGRVIPVIDLRLRIELPAAELDRASRVIVVGSRGRLLGLLVDAVHQVIHIDLSKVQPPPDDVMTVQSDYLSGVYQQDDRLILLLDIDRALVIQQAASTAPTDGPEVDRGDSQEATGL